MDWWDTPPQLFGPPGTAEMMRRLVHTFEYDIGVRNSLDRLNQHWQMPAIREFAEDSIHAKTATFARRPSASTTTPLIRRSASGWIPKPVQSPSPAIPARSSPSRKASHGVDLLLHEVYDSTTARRQLQLDARTGSASDLRCIRARSGIIGYHTLSEDLGPIAALADAPQLVLNHVIGPPDTSNMERDISRNYKGKVTVGADLQRFEIDKA